MRLGKLLTLGLSLSFFAAFGWYAWAAWIFAGIPKVEIREVTPLTAGADSPALPFFELMSPLPPLSASAALPKLEYKKGPPDRFIEKISVLFQAQPGGTKERITYYGRRTGPGFAGLWLYPETDAAEAHYLEAALRLSQDEPTSLSGLRLFALKPLLLLEASRLLRGVERVSIMDQAGTPAFLFESLPSAEGGGRARASALFVRRASLYRVDYAADRGFSTLDPEALFRRSFLTSTRADALGFIAHNLSEVKLTPENTKNLQIRDVAWPSLLLAAHVSVDPSSLDTFFHFAGLNTLLYRSASEPGSTAATDLEISDTLRNNVLSADAYARDIAPDAPRTREIARFARLLTRSLETE